MARSDVYFQQQRIVVGLHIAELLRNHNRLDRDLLFGRADVLVRPPLPELTR